MKRLLLLVALGATPALPAQSPATRQALEATLASLLTTHARLAAEASGRYLAGGGAAFTRAADSLDANGRQLSALVGVVYGQAAGDQFLELWRQHVGFVVDYAKAMKERKRRAYELAVVKLVGYAPDLADFFRAACPAIDRAAMVELLGDHIQELMRIVEAQAGRDPSRVPARVQAAMAHMPAVAGALAAGLATQFPDRFPSK